MNWSVFSATIAYARPLSSQNLTRDTLELRCAAFVDFAALFLLARLGRAEYHLARRIDSAPISASVSQTNDQVKDNELGAGGVPVARS